MHVLEKSGIEVETLLKWCDHFGATTLVCSGLTDQQKVERLTKYVCKRARAYIRSKELPRMRALNYARGRCKKWWRPYMGNLDSF